MNVAFAVRGALKIALSVSVFLANSAAGWGQSQAPQKEQAGAQAGSSGKAGEQMGSEGTTESPLRKCDSDTPKTDTKKKAVAKKKAKKPAPTTKTN